MKRTDEEPSTPDDAFFARVTGLVLNELAQALPDPAARGAALAGLVVSEIEAIEDREARVQISTSAYRAFYLLSLGHDPAEVLDEFEH